MILSARAAALVSLAAASLALLAACSAANDPAAAEDPAILDFRERVASRVEAVHHGTTAADPAVVALVVRRERCDAPPPLVNCTGTLIAPRAVLTAAHCVEGLARGSYEVFFGESPGVPGGSYRGIARRVIDPMYESHSDDHDLALLWLTSPAPVAPATLIGRGAIDTAWAGRAARAVGFGDAGEVSSASGARLAGIVNLTRIDANTLSYGPSPAMTCNGDSGGPLFVEQQGTQVVAAVTTSGDRLCEQKGIAARVDARLGDFIEPELAKGPPVDPPSIAPEAVCAAVCRSDADCPSDLACTTDLDGSDRCQLPNLFAGDFGAGCSQAADCGQGANCVPLGDECRCEQACVGTETGVDSSAMSVPDAGRVGASCRAAPSPRAPAGAPLGFVLIAAWVRRWRRKMRSPRSRLPPLRARSYGLLSRKI